VRSVIARFTAVRFEDMRGTEQSKIQDVLESSVVGALRSYKV